MAVEEAIDVAKHLIPPDDDDPKARKVWDWTVVGVLVGAVLSGGFHIAWACGWLAIFGLPGFARANEVATIQQQLTIIEKGQTKTEILTTRTAQCRVLKKGDNVDYLQSLTGQLNDALDNYYRLVGKPYRLPGCDEL